VLKGHKEVEDLKEPKAWREDLELRGNQEHQVQQGPQEQQVHRGIPPMDHQDSKELKVYRGLQGLKVPKVLKELRVLRDQQPRLVFR
jgi:hypothetical protein